jgi:excisionase family DNA binding protein
MLDGDPNLPLTAQQVAAFLRCHPRTVRRMIRDGILPAEKVRGQFYVGGADFIAWMRESKAIQIELNQSHYGIYMA